MKTKEELDTLKEEVDAVNEKLQELTEEELAQVSGGIHIFDKELESPDISGTSDFATPDITPSSGYPSSGYKNDPPKIDNYGPCGGIGRMDNVFEG